VVGYKIARTTYFAWNAYRQVQHLSTITADGLNTGKLSLLESPVSALSGALIGLEGEIRPFYPLFRRLDWIPTYGATLAVVPDLLQAGRELSVIGSAGLIFFSPVLTTNPSLDQLVATVAANGEALSLLSDRMQLASSALQRVAAEDLPPSIAGRYAEIAPLLLVLPDIMRITPLLPDLLGMKQERSYLVLVQNNHELRATGGFISAVGMLTLKQGRVVSMDFADSYDIYVPENTYPPAPLPMQKYMSIPIMLFRDGNWSPDLPTTARTVQALYAQDTGVNVNGVITIDLYAVRRIIGALGVIDVPGATAPISGENIIDQIKAFWEKPATGNAEVSSNFDKEWWEQRKDFVPLLAKAVTARLQAGNVDYGALLQAGLDALQYRELQIWVEDAQVAQILATLGWDGGLHPDPASDYLALVDTNIGYNKVDSVLNRSLRYEVTWPQGADAPGQATLTITYRHPFAVPGEENCDPTPRYGDTYDEMAARCYFDYVRVYAPSGSKLINTTGLKADSVVTQRGEEGTQVFAGFFTMKPGATHQVTFVYRLPERIQAKNYSLLLQRQSGIGAIAIEVILNGRSDTFDLQEGRRRWTPLTGAE
jgi:hypothetical protein